MKSLILTWIAIAVILLAHGSAVAATPPRGMVVYTDLPSTYVTTLEFVTIKETSIAFATVVHTDGKREEIPRAGIIAVINYPPDKLTDSLQLEADAALRSIQIVRAKYPQFSAKLDDIQARWSNILEVYGQGASPRSVALPSLSVDRVKYSQVVLESFDGKYAGIIHSTGAAQINATHLKPKQIDALNRTSTSARITFKPKQLDASNGTSTSARITSADSTARWIAEAVRQYPALSEKDSPLNQAFLAIYEDARLRTPEAFFQPDWPVRLAARAASSLNTENSDQKTGNVQTATTASTDTNNAESKTPRDDAATPENDYTPTLSPQDIVSIQNQVRDSLLQDKMVHVNSYERQSGVVVNGYDRQPPGGLTFGDRVEAEAVSWAIALGVEALDQGVQKFRAWWHEHQKTKPEDVGNR